MQRRHLVSISLAASLAAPMLTAAAVPDVAAGVDAVIDRQIERAQRQAEQRVPQVIEQTQERVAEQARQRTAEQIQQRTATQVQDRAASQIQDRASTTLEDRASRQVQDRTGDRILDAGSGPLAQRIPGQAGPAATVPATAPGLPDAQRPDPTTPPDRSAQGEQTTNPPFVEIMIEPDVRVIEREWIMLLTAAQRDELAASAPELMRYHVQTSPFEALDSYLLRFRVPPDLDSSDLMRQLVPASMRELLDRNHIYSTETGGHQGDADLTLPMAAVCADPVSIGIIDTAVNDRHPAFAARPGRAAGVVSRHFLTADMMTQSGHGTAVAGLLVGKGPELNPLLPNATLYSASVVYSLGESHQGATAIHLLEALDWLISEDVPVINMSLTGPANRVLEQGVNAALAKGRVIVAAAGNQGPHAPAQYPAAYEGVVTATAVASNSSIYRWANQGEHIDFAALGVAVPTALAEDFGRESGTSMAAPIVSAFVACALAAQEGDRGKALSMLERSAIDLGDPGHDPVFGHGLLHPSPASE